MIEVKGIHHTGISVSHLEASKAFYRDVLGMEVVREVKLAGEAFEEISGIPGADVDVCILQKGSTGIELLQYLSPQGGPNPHKRQYDRGIVHLSFIVDDADAAYEVLSGRGVRITSRPRHTREGGPKIFYCYGPDEEVLEFMQLP